MLIKNLNNLKFSIGKASYKVGKAYAFLYFQVGHILKVYISIKYTRAKIYKNMYIANFF